MKKLSFETGKSVLNFDVEVFDFRSCLLEHLAKFCATNFNHNLTRLEDIHLIPGITNDMEILRQSAFTCFRSNEFQAIWKMFSIYLLDTYFDTNALIQKTPTVRIQLPGGHSTSYHADSWYGHGSTVKSFWTPLVNVQPGNTLYMAKNKHLSSSVLSNILADQPSLSKINNVCKSACVPFSGSYGDILSFSSDMIHGTEINSLDYTRFSFDFRIAPESNDLGSKPRSNFFSRGEINGDFIDNKGNSLQSLTGITYSNKCKGVSAKTQLMVCAQFAEDNSIKVDGNESEILPMDYMPVLQHYISEATKTRNCIIVYGIEIFNGDLSLAKLILDLCKSQKKTIVFCAQGIVYENELQYENILEMVKR